MICLSLTDRPVFVSAADPCAIRPPGHDGHGWLPAAGQPAECARVTVRPLSYADLLGLPDDDSGLGSNIRVCRLCVVAVNGEAVGPEWEPPAGLATPLAELINLVSGLRPPPPRRESGTATGQTGQPETSPGTSG